VLRKYGGSVHSGQERLVPLAQGGRLLSARSRRRNDPVGLVHGPAVHALDRDAIFATTWQQVADTHQVAQPATT